jgi:hypothetical protein
MSRYEKRQKIKELQEKKIKELGNDTTFTKPFKKLSKRKLFRHGINKGKADAIATAEADVEL